MAKGISTDTPEVPLTDAQEGCRRYRSYIDQHYGARHPDGHVSYLLTRDDIRALTDGRLGQLDGIRIYIGHTGTESAPLVRLYVVGVRKKGTQHDDIFDTELLAEGKSGDGTAARTATLSAARIATGRPCPHQCSSTNVLFP